MGFALVLMILFALPAHLQAQSFIAQTFQEADGLADNRVHAVTQGPNGSILALTQDGVSSFDGLSWHTFADSLPFPNTRNVRTLRSEIGNAWVAGFSGKELTIARYNGQKWDDFSPPANLSICNAEHPVGFDVMETSPGEQLIVVSCGKRAFCFESKTGVWSKIGLKDATEDLTVRDVHFFQEQIFLLTNSGLWVSESCQEAVHLPLPTPNNHLLRMAPNPTGPGYFLLGDAWLGQVNHSSFDVLVENVQKTRDIPATVSELIATPDGRVIFGINSTFETYFLNDERGYKLDFSGQIEALWQNHVFLDREENVWISTDRGLAVISDLRFQHINHNLGLFEDEVTGMFGLGNDQWLLGGNYHVGLLANGHYAPLSVSYDKQEIHRSRAFLQRGDEVWFQTYQKGIGRVLPDTTLEWVAPSPTDHGISAFTHTNEALLVASEDLIFQWNGAEYHLFHRSPGYIREMLVRNGALWVLTTHGLEIRTTDGDWKHIVAQEPDLANLTCLIDSGEQVLLGSYGGPVQLREDELVAYHPGGQPLNRPVFGLLIDRRNNLWVGTDYGVYVTAPDGSRRHFHMDNGLAGNDINRGTLLEMDDDRIAIGTDRGLTIFHHCHDIKHPLTNPVPKLQAFSTKNGRSLLSESDVSVKAADNGLEVSFGAITFRHPQDLEYRYQLEGLETAWQTAHSGRTLHRNYVGLNGGTYRFSFQVRHNKGPWSPVIHSGWVSIARPFYLQYWFMATALLVLLLIGALVYRTFYQTRLKQQLELEVAENHKVIRQTDEHLRVQNEELSKVNQELDGFVYRVAHDLRGPLMKILGLVGVYRHEKGANQGLLDHMEESVTQMDRFIIDLLNFSRNSRTNRDIQDIDFRQMITDIFHHNAEAGEMTGVECSLHIHQKVAFFSDPVRLNMMLQNLISNALTYRNRDLTVRSIVEVEVNITHQEARIRITDNGVGIAKEEQGKIFDMFYRGHRDSQGSGLGLFIVKECLNVVGGQIRVQSKPDEGSSFIVYLPNLRQEQVEPTMILEAAS